ncbi:hypothetical protein [Eggerthella guodeyinii]|uniref:Uncharacterized protein n=1 Tax=Eggerthella guodeyinii TaxID=2690837 RepID=A0A6N7RIM4_9ACTN|nr:hypothetical protein [Eggerthella guodeyinii]MRX81099.1 hypothetical protein [Eggerthella guodeyinii]
MDLDDERKPRNSLDCEANLLDHFRMMFRNELCYLVPQDASAERIVQDVLNEKAWEDHSGKGALPPDFVCEERGLMLEVMRVDDHERPGDRKGYVNPLRARESEIIKEYAREFEDILALAADDASLTINAVTDLETEDDHSYRNYLSAFSRIVGKHASNAQRYRKNHPGSKLVFFVFDESSTYLEAVDPKAKSALRSAGDVVRGHSHLFFADKAFLDVVRRSGADYFIWCTPFKQSALFVKDLELPETVVYDVGRIDISDFEYDSHLMVSAEL